MNTYVYVGIITIFIAAFTLFFVFNSLDQLSIQCKANPDYSLMCSKLTGFTMSMLIILLIVGGFVITITASAYIMMSAS